MADFHSGRFGKDVWVTHHARDSMRKRNVDEATLQRVLEQGETRHSDARHLWVFLYVPDRSDNLICAAVTEAESVIVKTVMINWELRDER